MSFYDHFAVQFLDTLAQNGTSSVNNKHAIVQGNGSDLSNFKVIKGRAKRKLITQLTMLEMIAICESKNFSELKQSYWNSFHCQQRVSTAEGRLYGRYCKNRYCTVCCAIRKADILNRYLPTLEQWPDPYFLTLTVKSVPYNRLKEVMKSMIGVLRKIIAKYRKKSIRGKGQRLMGIRSLESNFNPVKKTYNPHFHIITPDKTSADIITKEWLTRSKPRWAVKWAQKGEPVHSNIKALIETVKYGSKIFTEPEMKKNRAKTGENHKVYVRAIHNIFIAMKGLRIFERFGFNLPINHRAVIGSRIVTNCKEWQFEIDKFDWVGERGERLTNYIPTAGLLHTLTAEIDRENE